MLADVVPSVPAESHTALVALAVALIVAFGLVVLVIALESRAKKKRRRVQREILRCLDRASDEVLAREQTRGGAER